MHGLVHIDYRLPIYVCTDACKEGIGGYLYQKRESSSEEQVVLCFSRSCSKDERKWDTHELELLATIATLEHMQCDIDGQRVTFETDTMAGLPVRPDRNIDDLCIIKRT